MLWRKFLRLLIVTASAVLAAAPVRAACNITGIQSITGLSANLGTYKPRSSRHADADPDCRSRQSRQRRLHRGIGVSERNGAGTDERAWHTETRLHCYRHGWIKHPLHHDPRDQHPNLRHQQQSADTDRHRTNQRFLHRRPTFASPAAPIAIAASSPGYSTEHPRYL